MTIGLEVLTGPIRTALAVRKSPPMSMHDVIRSLLEANRS